MNCESTTYIYINSNIEYTIQRIHIASYYTHSTRKWKISIVLSPYWQKLFWYLFIFIWYSWNKYVEVKDIYIFISNECQQNFYYIPIHTRKTCIQLKSFQSIWQGVIYLNVCAIWFLTFCLRLFLQIQGVIALSEHQLLSTCQ